MDFLDISDPSSDDERVENEGPVSAQTVPQDLPDGPFIQPSNIEQIISKHVDGPQKSTISMLAERAAQPIDEAKPAEFLPKPDEFSLAEYKVHPCPQSKNCNKTFCAKYHCIGERRRTFELQPQMCSEVEHCPSGETCVKCHSIPEYLYNRLVYKKMNCTLPIRESGMCDLGHFCPFNHAVREEIPDRPPVQDALVPMVKLINQRQEALLKRVDRLQLRELREPRCDECRTNKKAMILSPCGHAVCNFCSERIPGRCAFCQVQADMFPIKFEVT